MARDRPGRAGLDPVALTVDGRGPPYDHHEAVARDRDPRLARGLAGQAVRLLPAVTALLVDEEVARALVGRVHAVRVAAQVERDVPVRAAAARQPRRTEALP